MQGFYGLQFIPSIRYTIHSAVHSFRPDIKCIIHLHTPAAVAISACKQGLMAISQEAMIVGDVSYHDYHGIALTDEEKTTLQKSIGPYNKVRALSLFHKHSFCLDKISKKL